MYVGIDAGYRQNDDVAGFEEFQSSGGCPVEKIEKNRKQVQFSLSFTFSHKIWPKRPYESKTPPPKVRQ